MSNAFGRQVVLLLTNKSGGALVAGDVVVVDTGNNTAVTTTTTAGFTGGIGVVQESIASNAIGRVLISGYAALVNVNASVTRGNFGKTHTVAKQATDAGSTRGAGTFCQFLTGGTTPTALVSGTVDLFSSSLTDPTTTRGEIIRRGAAALEALQAKTAGKVLVGDGTDVVSAYPPGYEFDYVAKTSNSSITATTAGGADTVLTGNAVTYDGATAIVIEFGSVFGAPDNGAAGRDMTIGVFESTTEVGRLCYVTAPSTAVDYHPLGGKYRFTPSAGAHTYLIKAWVSAGTGTIGGGAGGAAAAPAFMRITKV